MFVAAETQAPPPPHVPHLSHWYERLRRRWAPLGFAAAQHRDTAGHRSVRRVLASPGRQAMDWRALAAASVAGVLGTAEHSLSGIVAPAASVSCTHRVDIADAHNDFHGGHMRCWKEPCWNRLPMLVDATAHKHLHDRNPWKWHMDTHNASHNRRHEHAGSRQDSPPHRRPGTRMSHLRRHPDWEI